MALNLLYLLPSDSQQTFTDKQNFNNDLINSLGGGPQGIQGIQGIQGVPGSQGLIGLTGATGTAGTKWYTRPGAPPGGILTPPQTADDDWFDTLNLNLWKYNGSTWILIGPLYVPGMFKTLGNSVVLTTYSNFVVISPINYVVDPSTGGKLKIIGTGSGSSILQLGIMETSVTESTPGSLTNIYLQKTSGHSSNTYDLHVENNSGGNTSFDLDGNDFHILTPLGAASLALYPVPTFQFFSSSMQLQLGGSDKVLSFSTGSAGTVKYHIGKNEKNDAYTNTSSRLFTVADDGTTGIGDVFTNQVIGEDSGNSGFMLDIMAAPLEISGASNWATSNKLLRLRSSLDGSVGGVDDFLEIVQNRLFADNEKDSTEWRIQKKTANSFQAGGVIDHFISFHGGNDTTNPDSGVTPSSLRFGSGGVGVGDGYFFGADHLGFVGFGDNNFVTSYNGMLDVMETQVNIEWGSFIHSGVAVPFEGDNSWAGQHMFFDTGNPVPNQYVGITAGYQSGYENSTKAGIIFKSDYGSGTSLHLLTSLASAYPNSGQRKRFSISAEGLFNFWAKDNLDLDGGSGTSAVPTFLHSLSIDISGGSGGLAPTTIINATDPLAIGMQTSGTLGIGITYTIHTYNAGDDFTNVGGVNTVGNTFVCAVNTIPNVWTHGSVLWSTGIYRNIIFQNNKDEFLTDITPTRYVGSGLVGIGDFSGTSSFFAPTDPQTKFHVMGAATVGIRIGGGTYDENIGTYSMTVGFLNYVGGGSDFSFVTGYENFIGNGTTGVAGTACAIIGGNNNAIGDSVGTASENCVIIGGEYNTIPINRQNVIVLGISHFTFPNIDNVVHTNNLIVYPPYPFSGTATIAAGPIGYNTPLQISAGNCSYGNDNHGGDLTLLGGNADPLTGTSYNGGNVIITGGNGQPAPSPGAGGNITISGGISTGAGSVGGNSVIKGGAAETGGNVTAIAGAGIGGNGGNALLIGGAGGSGSDGGIITITGGAGDLTPGNGGVGGHVNITAGAGDPQIGEGNTGGNVAISGGHGATGGNVTLTSGIGPDVDGDIIFNPGNGNTRIHSGDIITNPQAGDNADGSGWTTYAINSGGGPDVTVTTATTGSISGLGGDIYYKIIGKTIFINYNVSVTLVACSNISIWFNAVSSFFAIRGLQIVTTGIANNGAITYTYYPTVVRLKGTSIPYITISLFGPYPPEGPTYYVNGPYVFSGSLTFEIQ